MTKRCYKCREVYESDDLSEFFYKDCTRGDKLQMACKECCKQKCKDHYHLNREKILIRMKEYQKKVRDARR